MNTELFSSAKASDTPDMRNFLQRRARIKQSFDAAKVKYGENLFDKARRHVNGDISLIHKVVSADNPGETLLALVKSN